MHNQIIFYPKHYDQSKIRAIKEKYKFSYPFVTEEDVIDKLIEHANNLTVRVIVLEDEAVANNCLCEFATIDQIGI